MRFHAALLWTVLATVPSYAVQTTSSSLSIRFAGAARSMEESIPTGNGRMGAMMYGGIAQERISLNESSMWSGSPHDSDRLDAYQQLPAIRQLLLDGKNVEAEKLVNQSFTSRDKGGADPRYGSYQELGSLALLFPTLDPSSVTHYERFLDLDSAVATTRFTEHGVTYVREMFTSAADQAVVLHLTASQTHSLSLRMHLARVERFHTTSLGKQELVMEGELDSGAPDVHGLRYATRAKLLATGGSVTQEGDALRVEGADAVTILVTAATDYNGFSGRHTLNPQLAAAHDMQLASQHTWHQLLTRHKEEYRQYFHRVRLQLGQPVNDPRPAVERLAAASQGAADPALAELEFQFGRYLLISSSRPGGLPANLQGLWAEGKHTPWNGDWHLNINVQMNYWPAEETGLGDLTEPLMRLIASLQAPGSKTAKHYYNADGWVTHVMTNPWGYTAPGEVASWGSTIIGSAWLCQHIWQHYLYTGDLAFLRSMYPLMLEASRFYLSMLIAEPKHGWLVTAPSNSPENTFYMPNGKKASICMGPAIDEEILHFLFRATAQAGQLLHRDPDFQKRLLKTEQQLAPIQIGADGRIMEWLEPYREVDPHHRHVSHLWALYPDHQIDPLKTPALAQAAQRSLEGRGDEGTGWSLANKMLMWTELGDGDHAYRLLQHQWRPVDPVKQNTAGSFPNLWDSHPPFQIDGNFGTTAAIAEMLLQSREDELRILPALPSAWQEGSVDGLRAPRNIEVGMTWHQGTLRTLTLHSKQQQTIVIRYQQELLQVTLTPGHTVQIHQDSSSKRLRIQS